MNIVVKKINASNDEYSISERGKTILKVRHRRDLHTARIETMHEQRLLIIESEGLLITRQVIKNEYGVEIGQMNFSNWSDNEGFVQIENFRYRFRVNNFSSPELFIYQGPQKKLAFQCKISFENGSQSQLKEQLSPIIISTAWLLHLKTINISETVMAI